MTVVFVWVGALELLEALPYQCAIPRTMVTLPERLRMAVATEILQTMMMLEVLEVAVVVPEILETVAAAMYRQLAVVVVMSFWQVVVDERLLDENVQPVSASSCLRKLQLHIQVQAVQLYTSQYLKQFRWLYGGHITSYKLDLVACGLVIDGSSANMSLIRPRVPSHVCCRYVALIP